MSTESAARQQLGGAANAIELFRQMKADGVNFQNDAAPVGSSGSEVVRTATSTRSQATSRARELSDILGREMDYLVEHTDGEITVNPTLNYPDPLNLLAKGVLESERELVYAALGAMIDGYQIPDAMTVREAISKYDGGEFLANAIEGPPMEGPGVTHAGGGPDSDVSSQVAEGERDALLARREANMRVSGRAAIVDEYGAIMMEKLAGEGEDGSPGDMHDADDDGAVFNPVSATGEGLAKALDARILEMDGIGHISLGVLESKAARGALIGTGIALTSDVHVGIVMQDQMFAPKYDPNQNADSVVYIERLETYYCLASGKPSGIYRPFSKMAEKRNEAEQILDSYNSLFQDLATTLADDEVEKFPDRTLWRTLVDYLGPSKGGVFDGDIHTNEPNEYTHLVGLLLAQSHEDERLREVWKVTNTDNIYTVTERDMSPAEIQALVDAAKGDKAKDEAARTQKTSMLVPLKFKVLKTKFFPELPSGSMTRDADMYGSPIGVTSLLRRFRFYDLLARAGLDPRKVAVRDAGRPEVVVDSVLDFAMERGSMDIGVLYRMLDKP